MIFLIKGSRHIGQFIAVTHLNIGKEKSCTEFKKRLFLAHIYFLSRERRLIRSQCAGEYLRFTFLTFELIKWFSRNFVQILCTLRYLQWHVFQFPVIGDNNMKDKWNWDLATSTATHNLASWNYVSRSMFVKYKICSAVILLYIAKWEHVGRVRCFFNFLFDGHN
jgi:hypothetical protein